MTRYFFKDLGIIPSSLEKDKPLNWCLYISESEESGVFFTQVSPGIKDCNGGILYIAPEHAMPRISLRGLTAYNAKKHILNYYFRD